MRELGNKVVFITGALTERVLQRASTSVAVTGLPASRAASSRPRRKVHGSAGASRERRRVRSPARAFQRGAARMRGWQQYA